MSASGLTAIAGRGRQWSAQADLPTLPDPRVGLAGSISAVGLFSAIVTALTAGSVIGAGYAYSDVVALLGVQLAAGIAIWRIRWRAAAEAWLLVVIGLQFVFVATLITLTGGAASPYFALYAPVLAVAGWHLRPAPLALALGLVAVTELWRAYAAGATVSIEPLAITLPIYGLLAVVMRIAAQRSTFFHVSSRRDQVRTAATLDALRGLADRPPRDRAEAMSELALLVGDVLEAQAWVTTDLDDRSVDDHRCMAPAMAHRSLPLADGSSAQVHVCRALALSSSEQRLAGILIHAAAISSRARSTR
jgi:hypothetical protein